MKITCQSCQSKYTVSDEKVQGKTVKIKCRKCGATILVNSGGVTTSAPADPVSLSSGGQADGGASYLVNVTEGDQRSMTLPEIVAAYQTAVVTADTYVWADGMGDWQPLGQVDAIVAALHSHSAPPAAAVSSPGAAPAAEPEHRAAARRDPGRAAQDVFSAKSEEVATSAPSYSNGSPAAARPAPAPSNRGSEENSMLFSLSALTAKTATAAAPSAPKATTARDREDSGIIDLKALAAAAAAQSAPQPSAVPAAAAFLPDGGLFPLGAPPVGAPVGGGAAPPVVAPSMPPPKSKTPLFLGIGGVVAVGAIVAAFLVMKGSPPPPAPAAADTATAAPTATATAAPTASATASATPSAEPSAVASAAPTADVKAAKAGGGKASGGGGKAAPAGGGGKAAAASPAPAAAPPPAKKGGCGCAPGDLMCAMKCSAGK
ncbi:MAG: zinc-ribbon domain-containing protein [Minicystis sp.]